MDVSEDKSVGGTVGVSVGMSMGDAVGAYVYVSVGDRDFVVGAAVEIAVEIAVGLTVENVAEMVVGSAIGLHGVPLLRTALCGSPWEVCGSPWEVCGSPWEVCGSPWKVRGSPWSVRGCPWNAVDITAESRGGPWTPPPCSAKQQIIYIPHRGVVEEIKNDTADRVAKHQADHGSAGLRNLKLLLRPPWVFLFAFDCLLRLSSGVQSQPMPRY